ncbi:MAG TPA: tetratricopeptide repeat protein [Terriglobales bacterium]|nr:tetratricopeptide repeat protein [Terriglobales bacterium]
MIDRRHRAQELFSLGYKAQMQGELHDAVRLYSESIALWPTAEAYTFRGWAYSFQGNYQQAIEECLQAIALDPDFGNPYNDIGAYLIEQGKLDEAVEWLEKAAVAPRYDSPFFAYFNLGRVYERMGKLDRAERCFSRALEINPGYAPARQALRRLRARWN